VFSIFFFRRARNPQFMAKLARRLAVQQTCKLFIGGNWTDKFAAVAGSVNPVASSHFNFTVPEPTGVVVAVASDDPLLLGMVSLLAPIIVSGNCIVLVVSTAWKKFVALVEAQNGDASALEKFGEVHRAPIVREMPADRACKITAMDADKIGRASLLLGGGRQAAADQIDFALGISHLKKIGEEVNKDEPLMRVHARTEKSLARILPLLRQVAAIE
jgi:hypothetical protein